MIINKELTPVEKKLLEGQGVIFEEGRNPYFRKKEPVVPLGMRRLTSGKIVPYRPIEDCLKW